MILRTRDLRLRRPIGDYSRFAAALLRLASIHAAVAAVGFRASYRVLRARFAARPCERCPSRARRSTELCAAAIRRFGVESTCVHRSLLYYWTLRSAGLHAALRVGLATDPALHRAHAWVEHAGVVVGEAPTHDGRYVDCTEPFLGACAPSPDAPDPSERRLP